MDLRIERLKKLPQHRQERWQGGIFRMPAWVLNEQGTPHRPWSCLWVSPKTRRISGPADPTENKDLSMALDSFVRFACDPELAGYRPGVLEIKDAAVAEYMRKALSPAGITVECHSRLVTFESILADLSNYIGGDTLPEALSAKKVTVQMMRRFAEAAAEFYAAKPWRHLCDVDLIQIETPFVDPLLRHASIMGNGGMSYGFAFYDSAETFEQFIQGEGRELIETKPHWTVHFGGIQELPFGDADLWEDYNFPVASPQAYPLAICYNCKGKHRRPQPAILAFMEGLMRTFARTSESELDSGRWQKTVLTFEGEETYSLTLPDLLESTKKMSVKTVPFNRRSMEKMNVDLQRILDGHDFEDLGQMQQFIDANIVGKPVPSQYPMTPLEQAQDLCYEAFEARGRKQIQLARKALELCDDCVDAYIILAEACAEPAQAHELYLKGKAAGERLLGEKFFKEEEGHFWGIIQTRPYMRALLGVAQTFYDMDRKEEAVKHYEQMLRLNPNDNQGVRDCLLTCLLEVQNVKDAKTLLQKYKKDCTAVWHYSKALLAFIEKGDTAVARKHLAKAMKENPFVPQCLLDAELLPPTPSSYRLGSEEEAIYCADLLQAAWDVVPEALEWLANNAE